MSETVDINLRGRCPKYYASASIMQGAFHLSFIEIGLGEHIEVYPIPPSLRKGHSFTDFNVTF